MSSSPSRATIPENEATLLPRLAPQIAAFPYAEAQPRRTTVHSREEVSPAPNSVAPPVPNIAEREARAHAVGREEGLAEARKNFDEQVNKERAALSAALTQFARDRASYYQKIEAEVVQLSLSIARKILHRESNADPLLLAGIVRVALDKIENATGVTLRIHPSHAVEWRRYFTQHLKTSATPQIVEDTSIAPDRCILETSMGTAELGMEVQLKEIEKGLMDLIAARPERTR